MILLSLLTFIILVLFSSETLVANNHLKHEEEVDSKMLNSNQADNIIR